MRVKRAVGCLVSMLLSGVPSWARLGETEAEIGARFGQETGRIPSDAEVPGLSAKMFKKSGFVIIIGFLDGVSVRETYTLQDSAHPMDDAAMKELLAAESQGHHWQSVGDVAYSSRDDGATARIFPTEADFQSKQYLDAKAAHEKSLRPSVNGF